MMKQISQAVFLSAAVGLVGYLIFQNMSPQTMQKNAPLPVESKEAAEQLPPEKTAEQFAVVNQQRLQQLAGQPYKGPSYKEDYSQVEKMIAENKKSKDNKERMPANAEPQVQR